MSLKSVDMVTMVPRLTDVGKIQQIKDQEGQNAQQRFSAQLQAKVAQEQRQVNLPPESSRVERKPDDAAGGKQRDKRERKEQTAKATGPKKPAPGPSEGNKGSVIDIILGG